MSLEKLSEDIEKLKVGHASLREKEIRTEFRVGLVEKEIARIVSDFKEIKEGLAGIVKQMNKAIYIVSGFVLFSLAQEFGLLSVIKKIFL